MNLKEKEARLAKLVKSLQGKTLVVEGKRDAAALREFGFENQIVTAEGKPEGVVDKAKAFGKPIALLFDYDAEGKRKTAFFKERFLLEGVAASDLEWKRLRLLLGLRFIEELNAKHAELERELKQKKVN